MPTSSWAETDHVVALLGRLAGAADVPALFALAADEARAALGAERAVVLTVTDRRLTAADTAALRHHDSDVLRREVLAAPIDLPPRLLSAGARDVATLAALVGERLGLTAPRAGLIIPATDVLAVLVADGGDGEDAVAGFASVLGVALEHTILRRRVADVSSELRHLMASARALLGELQHAPLALPSTSGPAAVFPWDALTPDEAPAGDGLLGQRDVEILERLVAGRSNREIAEDLALSPDTVKGNVARILRKLGAANRVEAVSRYLAMTSRDRG